MPLFKRVYKKRVYKKKAPTAKLSKPMKKAVVKLIQGQAEKKFDTRRNPYSPGLLQTLIAGPINGFATDVSSFQPILPPLAQGITVSSRIGDRVRPTSCTLEICVSTLGTNNNSFDTMARIMVISDKGIRSYDDMTVSNINYNSLLDTGDSGPIQYVGDAHDNFFNINPRMFTTHFDKCYHLSKTQGLNTNSFTVTNGTIVSQAQNNFIKLRIKVPVPKILKYDEETAVNPTNFAPLLCVGFANMDGTQIQPNFLCMNWVCTLFYEDA